jgi:hypothetical protein
MVAAVVYNPIDVDSWPVGYCRAFPAGSRLAR